MEKNSSIFSLNKWFCSFIWFFLFIYPIQSFFLSLYLPLPLKFLPTFPFRELLSITWSRPTFFSLLYSILKKVLWILSGSIQTYMVLLQVYLLPLHLPFLNLLMCNIFFCKILKSLLFLWRILSFPQNNWRNKTKLIVNVSLLLDLW